MIDDIIYYIIYYIIIIIWYYILDIRIWKELVWLRKSVVFIPFTHFIILNKSKSKIYDIIISLPPLRTYSWWSRTCWSWPWRGRRWPWCRARGWPRSPRSSCSAAPAAGGRSGSARWSGRSARGKTAHIAKCKVVQSQRRPSLGWKRLTTSPA